jgi:hypothetical protein
MRSHSGKDEGRDNLHDPTLRDKERARGKSGTAVLDRKDEPSGPEPKQRTTEMGSHARKTGQQGHGSHR